jgi:hypothetical protein
MNFSTTEDWKSKVTPFITKWTKKLEEILSKNDILEFFMDNHWGNFDPDFQNIFPNSIPKLISSSHKEPEWKNVITRVVALIDLKASLQTSLDGEGSLSPQTYLSSILDELKELNLELEKIDNVAQETIHLSISDLVTAEPQEDDEPELVLDDMVEEIVDIGEEGENILNSVDSMDMNTGNRNNPFVDKDSTKVINKSPVSGLLPKPKAKTTKGYDSAMHKMDPLLSGPIVSLSGMRKKSNPVSNSRPKPKTTSEQIVAPILPSSNLSPALKALRDAIERVDNNSAPAGEKEILENVASKFFRYDPTDPQILLREMKYLDQRLSIISGEEGDYKVEAIMVTDRLSTILYREIEKIVAMASPKFLRLNISNIEEKDDHAGEYRAFDLEFTTKNRVIGFHKGNLNFTLLYYPHVVRFTISASGNAALSAPFHENTATLLIDYDENSPSILVNYAFTCLNAYISSIIN